MKASCTTGQKIGMCFLIGSLLLTLLTTADASGASEHQQAVPVLTYHAEHPPGRDTAAFREDLRLLDRLGFKIVPLS